jgi:hypothetical protein
VVAQAPRSTHYDLLDRDLVYDWIWVTGAWDRVGPAALRAREQSGSPELFDLRSARAGPELGDPRRIRVVLIPS